MAGCNSIEDIADYAKLKKKWFEELTGTSFGTPSYNTFWFCLVRVQPKTFKQLLSSWFQKLSKDLVDQLLVIDGKRLKGISDNENITHIVELFAAQDRLVIAQTKVPDKKGEAKSLPELLKAVDIKGAIVSMDALYSNTRDTQQVINFGADYIVGMKMNQPKLYNEIVNHFELLQYSKYTDDSIDYFEYCEKGHGRIEERKICVNNNLDWLPQKKAWSMNAMIKVHSERVINGKVEKHTRYFGSSRNGTAKEFSKWIREHWAIENNLHWVADVVFKEDDSLGDTGYSAENMSLIKRLAMNIVQAFDGDRGMAAARRCATHSQEYLRGLLGKVFC